MNRLIAIAGALLIAGPAAAEWERIESKAALARQVVGTQFIEPKSKAWFRLNADGSLSGAYQGKDLTGTWKWRSKRVCYTRKLGGERLPDNCITIHIDGNNLATTRQKGGTQVFYVRGK